MASHVSESTRRNWRRLRVADSATRLRSRANKTHSERRIVPVEYLADRGNCDFLLELAEWAVRENCPPDGIVYSLCINMLRRRFDGMPPHAEAALAPYARPLIPEVIELDIPENEYDLPGLVLQCLKTEGEKNVYGSYFTPKPWAVALLEGLDFSLGQTLFEPGCGSAAILCAAPAETPEQLFGVDIDPLAVLAARTNLLLKFPDREFIPQIFELDFLNGKSPETPPGGFDCVAANPPWGAAGKRGESFSAFMFRSFALLKPGGALRFLLPQSVLDVARHWKLRNFMLNSTALEKIAVCPGSFTGVTSRFVSVNLAKKPPCADFEFASGGRLEIFSADISRNDPLRVIRRWSARDAELIEKIRRKGKYNLADSVWALGIVTGDNRSKVRTTPLPGDEPVLTGREIQPFKLLTPSKFLRFDPENFQQTAPEAIYRAPEKLVYKFISNRPVFACDNESRLFLNSANILIPKLPGYSVKSAMALLNSGLFSWLHLKLSGQVKVLKSTLCMLPFPALTEEQNRRLTALAETASRQEIEDIVMEIFGLAPDDRAFITRSLAAGR
ncbi:MAG: TaqI-like C-terminal specificity domain-containing protein [Victivallaceae bacterium]|nr:TaqI-like C-terminal specificity domain-containing protein [Victivallaceae bacterium]